MTVLQNLHFYARLYDVKNYELVINNISSELRIDELLNKNWDPCHLVKKQRLICVNLY